MSSKGIINVRNQHWYCRVLTKCKFYEINELDFIYFCVPTVLNSVLLKLNTMFHWFLRHKVLYISIGGFIKYALELFFFFIYIVYIYNVAFFNQWWLELSEITDWWHCQDRSLLYPSPWVFIYFHLTSLFESWK